MSIMKISCVIFVIFSCIVWWFQEESITDFGQGIYFFIGSFGQMGIGYFIFYKHNMFDRKVIVNSQFEKWRAQDYIIKQNSYITLSNQAINQLIFTFTYYFATFFGIDIIDTKITDKNFERFHRRFLSYGFGTVFAYFIVKSLSNQFCQGTQMVTEILSRQTSEGIEEDHPKNPAKILSNIGESFFRLFHNCLEYNAQTNMGLCIFQDFFVTRSVYLLDRGFQNSLAIYSFGMTGSLIAMLIFRRSNKGRLSSANEFNVKLKSMKINAFMCLIICGVITMIGNFVQLNYQVLTLSCGIHSLTQQRYTIHLKKELF